MRVRFQAGDRVKLSAHAFANGVYQRSKDTLRKRGAVVRKARMDNCYVVQWDDRKTVEHLDEAFIMRATTGAHR